MNRIFQVVPGLEAKRLWRFNGDFFAHDARRDLKKRGERLEIRGTKLSGKGSFINVTDKVLRFRKRVMTRH